MVYAIIEDRGEQYKVTEGQVLDVDLIELSDGQDTSKVGTPVVAGAKVIAKVETSEVKGPKVEVVNFIRRKGHLTHTGHRQKYTRVRIEKIEA